MQALDLRKEEAGGKREEEGDGKREGEGEGQQPPQVLDDLSLKGVAKLIQKMQSNEDSKVVCVYACVCACVCVSERTRACVCVCVCNHAIDLQ